MQREQLTEGSNPHPTTLPVVSSCRKRALARAGSLQREQLLWNVTRLAHADVVLVCKHRSDKSS